MFGLFCNDEFKNFWSNNQGDIFLEATCRSLKLDKGQVDLVYYMGLDSVPEFKDFTADKKLHVLKKVITETEEEVIEEGTGLVTYKIVEVESYELDKVYEPIVYLAKGIMVKPC